MDSVSMPVKGLDYNAFASQMNKVYLSEVVSYSHNRPFECHSPEKGISLYDSRVFAIKVVDDKAPSFYVNECLTLKLKSINLTISWLLLESVQETLCLNIEYLNEMGFPLINSKCFLSDCGMLDLSDLLKLLTVLNRKVLPQSYQ